MVAQWFYQTAEGRQSGPIDPSELRRLAEAGIVKSNTLVRKGASGGWVRAENVRGLFQLSTPTSSQVAAITTQTVVPRRDSRSETKNKLGNALRYVFAIVAFGIELMAFTLFLGITGWKLISFAGLIPLLIFLVIWRATWVAITETGNNGSEAMPTKASSAAHEASTSYEVRSLELSKTEGEQGAEKTSAQKPFSTSGPSATRPLMWHAGRLFARCREVYTRHPGIFLVSAGIMTAGILLLIGAYYTEQTSLQNDQFAEQVETDKPTRRVQDLKFPAFSIEIPDGWISASRAELREYEELMRISIGTQPSYVFGVQPSGREVLFMEPPFILGTFKPDEKTTDREISAMAEDLNERFQSVDPPDTLGSNAAVLKYVFDNSTIKRPYLDVNTKCIYSALSTQTPAYGLVHALTVQRLSPYGKVVIHAYVPDETKKKHVALLNDMVSSISFSPSNAANNDNASTRGGTSRSDPTSGVMDKGLRTMFKNAVPLALLIIFWGILSFVFHLARGLLFDNTGTRSIALSTKREETDGHDAMPVSLSPESEASDAERGKRPSGPSKAFTKRPKTLELAAFFGMVGFLMLIGVLFQGVITPPQMGTLTYRIKQAARDYAEPRYEVDGFGRGDEREKAIIDRHKSELSGGGSLLQKVAAGRASLEIDARRQQRAYAEKPPSALAQTVVAPAREMLSNLGDRRQVLGIIRKMTPEQREEALKLAPGVGQQIGDDRVDVFARCVAAFSRGVTHGWVNPMMELVGIGGTEKEIQFIRQLDEIATQEFHPYRPSDPWSERVPLQAIEMLPWVFVIGALIFIAYRWKARSAQLKHAQALGTYAAQF